MDQLGKSLANMGVDSIIQRVPEGESCFLIRKFGLKIFNNLSKRSVVNRGETVICAGVNKVKTISDFREAVGPYGHVIGIEADPKNVEILRRGVEEYRWDNVNIIQKAVWDCKDNITFSRSPNPGRSEISYDETNYELVGNLENEVKDSQIEKINVHTDTIDNILTRIGIEQVDHLHVTVSGGALKAVQGAKDTLNQHGISIQIRCPATEGATYIDHGGEPLIFQIESLLEKMEFKTVSTNTWVYATNI